MYKYTVNPYFLRLQPKITKIQKIQKGTKNEGKWEEARRCQKKQWLIIFEFTFCVFCNSYGLIKTEIYMNTLLSSILYRQEKEK